MLLKPPECGRPSALPSASCFHPPTLRPSESRSAGPAAYARNHLSRISDTCSASLNRTRPPGAADKPRGTHFLLQLALIATQFLLGLLVTLSSPTGRSEPSGVEQSSLNTPFLRQPFLKTVFMSHLVLGLCSLSSF